MQRTPEIETRTEQPYVAIRARVRMAGIAAFAVRTGEVFGWLGARGLAPAGGPPFLKFNVIDMVRELEMEAASRSRRPWTATTTWWPGSCPPAATRPSPTRATPASSWRSPGPCWTGAPKGPDLGHIAVRGR